MMPQLFLSKSSTYVRTSSLTKFIDSKINKPYLISSVFHGYSWFHDFINNEVIPFLKTIFVFDFENTWVGFDGHSDNISMGYDPTANKEIVTITLEFGNIHLVYNDEEIDTEEICFYLEDLDQPNWKEYISMKYADQINEVKNQQLQKYQKYLEHKSNEKSANRMKKLNDLKQTIESLSKEPLSTSEFDSLLDIGQIIANIHDHNPHVKTLK